MNLKLIVLGGLAFWIAGFITSMITGQLIHTALLADAYNAAPQFWRPELNQDPPDMAALMPEWILSGVVSGLVIAAIYNVVRPAFDGAGWNNGLRFGLLLAAFVAAYHLALSGVFDVAGKIWLWWSVDAIVIYAISGIALGVVAEKFAPRS